MGMFKKSTSKIFLAGLFVLIGFILVFPLETKARDSFVDECTNQDTCPGMCRIAARFTKEGVDQYITLYNEKEVELGKYTTDKGEPWTLFFKLSLTHCGLGYYAQNAKTDLEAEAKKYIQARIVRYPAFCCCKAEAGGNVSCKRWVTRDLTSPSFPMKCEDGYNAREDKSGGANCKSFEKHIAASTIPTIDLFERIKILNQLPNLSSPGELIGIIARILLAFIGSIALGLYVWAGVLWMGAAGNTDRVEKAKQILAWTTLGVAVMLGSYVVVNYVFGFI